MDITKLQKKDHAIFVRVDEATFLKVNKICKDKKIKLTLLYRQMIEHCLRDLEND